MKMWQILIIAGVILPLATVFAVEPKVEEAGFMETVRHGQITWQLTEDTDALKCAAQKMANGVKEMLGNDDEAGSEDACGTSLSIPYNLILIIGAAMMVSGFVSRRRG